MSGRIRIVLFPVLVAAAMLGGCANQNSIFRRNQFSAQRPTVITVDAKQRHLLMVPVDGHMRVCAEAAPDVFSALSTSAGANLGFGQSGGQTDAQARAAIAIAEAAGTIERTQTINLFRESMYQTCLRFMSGGIDRATFVVQAGRDWRAMIGILAIEQLTGTVRPPSTIISAGSTSAAVEDAVDVARQLAIAQDAERLAQQELGVAQLSDPQSCTPLTDANRDACTQKTARIAAAQANFDRAKHNREVWERVMASPPPPIRTAATTGAGPDHAGGATTPPNGPSDTVARVVGDIVRQAFATDETQLFCLQILSNDTTTRRTNESVSGTSGETVEQLCMQYLAARVQSDIERLRNWQVSRTAGERFDAQTRIIEQYLLGGPGTPAERWNALVAPFAPRFGFGNEPIEAPADATVDQIRARMQRLGSALDELVIRIQQGGS